MNINNVNINEIPTSQLEEMAHHNVNLKDLASFISDDALLNCWPEIHKLPRITKKDIIKCVKDGTAELTSTPSLLNFYTNDDENSIAMQKEAREKHIKKIAYFYLNEPETPISIDLDFMGHIIEDGNHRLFGQLLKESPTIKVCFLNPPDITKEYGFWNPNEYLLELEKRYAIERKEQLISNLNDRIDFCCSQVDSNNTITISFLSLIENCKVFDNINYFIDDHPELNDELFGFANELSDSTTLDNKEYTIKVSDKLMSYYKKRSAKSKLSNK